MTQLHEVIQELRVKAYLQENEEVALFTPSGETVHRITGGRQSVSLALLSDSSLSGLMAFHNHPMLYGKEYGLSVQDILTAVKFHLHSVHAVTAHQIFSFINTPNADWLNSPFAGYALAVAIEQAVDRVHNTIQSADRFRLTYLSALQSMVPGLFSVWITDPLVLPFAPRYPAGRFLMTYPAA